MIQIPFQINATEYNLLIVLQDDSFARMKLYDPAQVEISFLPAAFKHKHLRMIIIGYGTDEDVQKTIVLANEGKIQEALDRLTKGFAFRPDLGDYDGPGMSVVSDKNETKQ